MRDVNERKSRLSIAIMDLNGEGARAFKNVLLSEYFGLNGEAALEALLTETPVGMEDVALCLIKEGGEHRNNSSSRRSPGKPGYWAEIAKYPTKWLAPEMRNLLCGTNRAVREVAAGWLAKNDSEHSRLADTLKESRQITERIGAAHLLSGMGGDSRMVLQEWHGKEPSKAVRETIAELLAAHGVETAPEKEKTVERIEDFTTFEKLLAKNPKAIKAPKAPWLTAEQLPPIFTKNGHALSDLARTFLFQRQAREKGEIHTEVAPFMEHLARAKNATFAHALLDQWFASDMKAPTRWALDVAGITGDDSIIVRLVDPIEKWCEQNHGSRAEWVAHAIALLGSQKALGTLDGLIHRYRSRRKYVGAAASQAIYKTAEMMGISADELAERIVPDFGFDSEGERDFPARNGAVRAVLFHDFKIGWRDGDRLVAKPPEKPTAEAEEELKETRKFIREAVTRQTMRLKDAMIGGRHWQTDVWKGRFTSHPLFRIFGMRLVWGVYDGEGKLLKTFRIYPNGLFADGAGELVEIGSAHTTIGIPHRMEINDTDARDWMAHLKRFKVKPLFSQLDRPILLLNPEHENRKGIQFTTDIVTTAGIVRKTLLGKGWAMAAPGDGGWLQGLWRRFPGTEIEAYLPVGNLHAASGKDERVTLHGAYFAVGEPGKTNCRDFPSESAAETFGKVPGKVYSEAIGDLEALLKQS